MKAKEHTFKVTIDDGFCAYQYDVTLDETWSIYDIMQSLQSAIKPSNGKVSEGTWVGRQNFDK